MICVYTVGGKSLKVPLFKGDLGGSDDCVYTVASLMERVTSLFMNTLSPILISLIVAIWVVVMAIISVQNATLVSLRFLTFQSVQLPVGLLLAFSAGIGLIGMSLLQPLWGIAGSLRGQSRFDEDAEFFVDDEDF
jgi:uncharacterized integral membrane protein